MSAERTSGGSTLPGAMKPELVHARAVAVALQRIAAGEDTRAVEADYGFPGGMFDALRSRASRAPEETAAEHQRCCGDVSSFVCRLPIGHGERHEGLNERGHEAQWGGFFFWTRQIAAAPSSPEGPDFERGRKAGIKEALREVNAAKQTAAIAQVRAEAAGREGVAACRQSDVETCERLEVRLGIRALSTPHPDRDETR